MFQYLNLVTLKCLRTDLQDLTYYPPPPPAQIPVLWIRIRIHFGRLDPDPHWESGSALGIRIRT
jgi:hypothetical protein